MPCSNMPSKSTRPSFFSLKVDDDDPKERLDGYKTLKITKSNRGMSFLAVLVSLGLTFALALPLHVLTTSAIVGLVIYMALATFAHKGHRGALIALMIRWTAGKFYQVYGGGLVVTILFWWATFVSISWKALVVENGRREACIVVAAPAVAPPVA